MNETIKEKEVELNMRIMANVLYVVMFGFIILYAFSFVKTVIYTVQSASAYGYLPDSGKADFLDHWSCRLIDTLTMTVISVLGFNIFRRFKKDKTPFVPYIGRDLRVIAIVLLVGWLLMFGAHIFADVTAGAAPPNEYSGFINGTSMMFVSIFIMLGYIFDYGCKLQKESDETL